MTLSSTTSEPTSGRLQRRHWRLEAVTEYVGVTSGYRAELQMGLMFLKYHTVFGVFMGRNEDLRQIVEMAGREVIRGVVHQTFPLEDAAKAHEAMEAREFFGKLVLAVP